MDDRNEDVIDSLTDKVFGKLYAVKEYISQSLFGHIWNDGIHIVTGLRSNMKQRLMPLYDKMMLRKRSIIESITICSRMWHSLFTRATEASTTS